MHDMTAANLRSAFAGESMAHMRYGIWAAKAERDGFPNVARLFRAVLHAERVHATMHFSELRAAPGAFMLASMGGFGMGTTSQNLQGAIDGESFEVTEMYPAYLETAKAQNEAGAQRCFGYAAVSEKIHAALYLRAKQAVDSARDVELKPVHVCDVCGCTVEGELPETCPLCNAKKDRFATFA